MQQDHILNYWHCGGRNYAPSRKLQSVDAEQDYRTGVHCQEDELQPAQPDRYRVLRSQVTPRVHWHHRDVLHQTTGS